MYFELLEQWCDELIASGDRNKRKKYMEELCARHVPGFMDMWSAIYPLMYMADRTGDSKYLESANCYLTGLKI